MSDTADRHAEGYEPRYDIDSEVGRQGSFFVMDIIDALKGDRVEVKRDLKSQETGNIYLEYECKKRGRYVKSGLAITEADLWVFVLDHGDLALAVSTDLLKKMGRVAFTRGQKKECQRGSHPTRGVVIPISELAEAGTIAGKARALRRLSA